MRTTQEIAKDIAKHRKLLHRAVGNHLLSSINYHYECIVQLVKEHNIASKAENERLRVNMVGILRDRYIAGTEENLKTIKQKCQECDCTELVIIEGYECFAECSECGHLNDVE